MRSTLVAASAVLMALTVLSGCLDGKPDLADASDSPAAVARLSPDEWTARLSKPVYDGIVSTVGAITAEDGTRLSYTLHLPEGLADGTTIPTLMEITPYQAFLNAEYNLPVVGTQGAGPSWAEFVLRGAAYVEADARGTTRSGGCLDFGGSADRADAVAFAAWAKEQPWSNGVVVTDGISHPGMGSVVAHAAVPELAGALAHAPVVSYYRDEWYDGAKFENQANGPAYQAVELGPAVDTDPGALASQAALCTGQTTLDYNSLDGRFHELWDDRDLSRHRDAATSPILLTQGFVDQNVHPDHVQLYWDSLPDDFPKAVIWGWWYHGWPDLDGHPAEDFEDVRHRWLDALLFGADNGLSSEPRVLVEDSQGTWHEGHDWPLEPSQWATLWADGDGGMLSDGDLSDSVPAKESAASYNDVVNAYRGVWDDAHVAFRTPALPRDTLVNGAPKVELVASSTATATKWVAYLMDEAPDGSWQRISHGYIDSHQWNGEADWQPIEPGKPYTWNLTLMPTAVVVEAGHRITLVVASQDSSLLGNAGTDRPCFEDHTATTGGTATNGCYDPSGIQPAPGSAGLAVNTVHTGPGGTRVHVATVDPALTQKVPWPA
jgi:predicted acyl esterase